MYVYVNRWCSARTLSKLKPITMIAQIIVILRTYYVYHINYCVMWQNIWILMSASMIKKYDWNGSRGFYVRKCELRLNKQLIIPKNKKKKRIADRKSHGI